MANQDYYDASSPSHERSNAPLPSLPTLETNNKPLPRTRVTETPISPFDEDSYRQSPQSRRYADSSYGENTSRQHYNPNPFSDDAAIPLQTQYPKYEDAHPYASIPNQQDMSRHYASAPDQQDMYRQEPPRRRPHKKRKKEPFFSWHTPWFIYTITLIQIIIFIAEIIKNGVLTGTPIEIHPNFNPMIGPSPYVLINMGARYVPCMRNQNQIQNSVSTIAWPCPNQTDTTPTCSLSDLCGFGGVPNPKVGASLTDSPMPDQWFRFIVPIFLHAGIIHIGFNMLLQVLLGGDMERLIGPLRLALVYFSSGIFGFVMGGNFAASGIASTGASGSIFGIIALTLLDILYTWSTRPKPLRDLLFICLDIVICFVLGLLPGLDNFSHIGGFLMGLVLGICLLRSPTPLRKRLGSLQDDKHASAGPLGAVALQRQDIAPTGSSPNLLHPTLNTRDNATPRASDTRMFTSPQTFFAGRKPLWWAWWLLRAGALVGVIIAFVWLINSFYAHHDTQCPSCKYLSCLPVSNWCEIGQLTFNNQTSKA